MIPVGAMGMALFTISFNRHIINTTNLIFMLL